MKITRKQLKQIIKEELEQVLKEQIAAPDKKAKLAGPVPYTQADADFDELVADGYDVEVARDILEDPKRLADVRARGIISPLGNVEAVRDWRYEPSEREIEAQREIKRSMMSGK